MWISRLFASLRPLHVEENTPDRLQLQFFDATMGFVFFVMGGVGGMAGVFNLQRGNLIEGIGAILLAQFFLATPLAFMGVKRLTIDRAQNKMWLTNRAVLRYSQDEFLLSDIEGLALVDQTTGTSGPKDLGIGEEFVAKRNAYYVIEARFADREPHVLYSRSGISVYRAGQVILTWWQQYQKSKRTE